MNQPQTIDHGLTLKVNGALLAVGRRPALEEWTPALRGIALSDSPVLIQASHQDAAFLLDRIHRLGRRRELPVYHCHTEAESDALLSSLSEEGEVSDDALGTWAIYNVHWWSEESQNRLSEVLGRLDEARLHGRLRHDRIPRVVVTMTPETFPSNLQPELGQRLSYYHLSALQTKQKGANDASR